MSLSYGNDSHRYKTRIEMTGKIGYSSKKSSKRNIARLGFVLPVFQVVDSYITYLTLIGMKDSAKHVEGNLGIGYRSFISPEWILGEYVFYDLRSTENSNLLSQITIGLEAFSKNLEIRVNGYIPTKRQYELNNYNSYRARYNSHLNNTQLTIKHNKLLEQGVPGFDIELGGSPRSLSKVELFVAYYHFSGKKLKSTIGGRFRSNINLLHWLILEGEMNYDNNRRFVSYVGIRLSWALGNGKASQDWTHVKMTNLPVRDIDIINSCYKEEETLVDSLYDERQAFIIKTGPDDIIIAQGSSIAPDVDTLIDELSAMNIKLNDIVKLKKENNSTNFKSNELTSNELSKLSLTQNIVGKNSALAKKIVLHKHNVKANYLNLILSNKEEIKELKETAELEKKRREEAEEKAREEARLRKEAEKAKSKEEEKAKAAEKKAREEERLRKEAEKKAKENNKGTNIPQPPINGAPPPINGAPPPINGAPPPINGAPPPINGAPPPINGAAPPPPINGALPPPINGTLPPPPSLGAPPGTMLAGNTTRIDSGSSTHTTKMRNDAKYVYNPKITDVAEPLGVVNVSTKGIINANDAKKNKAAHKLYLKSRKEANKKVNSFMTSLFDITENALDQETMSVDDFDKKISKTTTEIKNKHKKEYNDLSNSDYIKKKQKFIDDYKNESQVEYDKVKTSYTKKINDWHTKFEGKINKETAQGKIDKLYTKANKEKTKIKKKFKKEMNEIQSKYEEKAEAFLNAQSKFKIVKEFASLPDEEYHPQRLPKKILFDKTFANEYSDHIDNLNIKAKKFEAGDFKAHKKILAGGNDTLARRQTIRKQIVNVYTESQAESNSSKMYSTIFGKQIKSVNKDISTQFSSKVFTKPKTPKPPKITSKNTYVAKIMKNDILKGKTIFGVDLKDKKAADIKDTWKKLSSSSDAITFKTINGSDQYEFIGDKLGPVSLAVEHEIIKYQEKARTSAKMIDKLKSQSYVYELTYNNKTAGKYLDEEIKKKLKSANMTEEEAFLNTFGQPVNGITFKERISKKTADVELHPDVKTKHILSNAGINALQKKSVNFGIEHSYIENLKKDKLIRAVPIGEQKQLRTTFRDGKKTIKTYDFFKQLSLTEEVIVKKKTSIYSSDRYLESVSSYNKHPEYVARKDKKSIKTFSDLVKTK